MSEVTVYGAPYSTYVRAVRLALEEKGVPYDLVEVGILEDEVMLGQPQTRKLFPNTPVFRSSSCRPYDISCCWGSLTSWFAFCMAMPSNPWPNLHRSGRCAS